MTQFRANTSSFTDVAFEIFNLGPNSTLILNNLTRVASPLKQLGLSTWAMISSYPYPPEFLTWMRQVFTDPQPFITSLVSQALDLGLTGVNVDWEPTSGNGAPPLTPADPLNYASFLDTLSAALHEHGILVSVDVATWSAIWDLEAIGATRVDYIMNMETYVVNDTLWKTELADSLRRIPSSKLVVGLENHEAALMDANISMRFTALKEANVSRIGIWRSGIEDSWWPYIKAFAATTIGT